jgi:geranylgeranyl pyrophosphate synthase
VADDIMDSSVTRRGQPCSWYNKNKALGDAWYIAINYAFTIKSLVYKMIKSILPMTRTFAATPPGSHDGNHAADGTWTT